MKRFTLVAAVAAFLIVASAEAAKVAEATKLFRLPVPSLHNLGAAAKYARKRHIKEVRVRYGRRAAAFGSSRKKGFFVRCYRATKAPEGSLAKVKWERIEIPSPLLRDADDVLIQARECLYPR